MRLDEFRIPKYFIKIDDYLCSCSFPWGPLVAVDWAWVSLWWNHTLLQAALMFWSFFFCMKLERHSMCWYFITVGFQTPWGWMYDWTIWTPKAYHPNTEPQEVFGRLGTWFHYHYHCLMRHNHKCFCLPHLRPRVASCPGWLERTVWHICSSRQAKTNEENLKVEQVLY